MENKETKEELLARMPAGAEKAIEKMSEKVVADMKRAKRQKKHFFGKRNRRAFIRQERPHVVASKERGLEKIWAFHRRAAGILAYHRYLVWHRETLSNDRELTHGDPRVDKGHSEVTTGLFMRLARRMDEIAEENAKLEKVVLVDDTEFQKNLRIFGEALDEREAADVETNPSS